MPLLLALGPGLHVETVAPKAAFSTFGLGFDINEVGCNRPIHQGPAGMDHIAVEAEAVSAATRRPLCRRCGKDGLAYHLQACC